MAPHSSTLAWKIPWAEEPGRLQSMGLRRVGHDWATSLSLFTFMHWRRKWQPAPVFLPGESRDGRAWWAAVYGVAQSGTQLKWRSSRSSSSSSSSKLLSRLGLHLGSHPVFGLPDLVVARILLHQFSENTPTFPTWSPWCLIKSLVPYPWCLITPGLCSAS